MRFLLLLCADTSVAQSYELPGCEAWSKDDKVVGCSDMLSPCLESCGNLLTVVSIPEAWPKIARCSVVGSSTE